MAVVRVRAEWRERPTPVPRRSGWPPAARALFLLAFDAGWRRRRLLQDFSGVSGRRHDGGVVNARRVAKAKGSLVVADRHASVTLFPGATTYSR